jgi:hypothetical protein
LFPRKGNLLGLLHIQLKTRHRPQVANLQRFAERACTISSQELFHHLFQFAD